MMNRRTNRRINPRLAVRVSIAFAILVAPLLACNVRSFLVSAPTSTPTALSTPAVFARATSSPVRIAQPTPTWWDAQIGMPTGAEFIGDARRAVWSTRDQNAEGVKDFFVRQASAAGYRAFVTTQSQDAIYDVLVALGQTAFALNITLGSDVTIISVNRTGVLRLQVSGIVNLELDMPMRTRVDVAPGSEISIGASVPSPQCARCEYFINVHIAPFRGVGNYDSKPGISIIDVELVPGGDRDLDNFRWAQSCAVTVNQNGGSFDCRGLQNMHDTSKKLDASGSWSQPSQ